MPTTSAVPATVLVVDDDPMVLYYVLDVLSTAGYGAIGAPDGPAAVRLFEERRETIQLLVTDVMMPGMSGRELADTLRAARADLRVLYISGLDALSARDHGVDCEAGALLRKPFLPATLLRAVRSRLEA